MLRWPVVRHLRYYFHAYRCYRFAQWCGQRGLGLGHPNPHDLAVLEAIWKGEA